MRRVLAAAFAAGMLLIAPSGASALGVGVASNAFPDERDGAETMFTKSVAELPGGVLAGEVVHVGRGCDGDPYLSDPAGLIALIERGVCTFVEKIQRAHAAGATAAIVYNDDTNPGDSLFLMGGSGMIEIPGISVSRNTGLSLRDHLSPPVLVEVRTRLLSHGPSVIDFGTRMVGTTSGPETVTLTSYGSGAVPIGQAFLDGDDAGHFVVVDDECSNRSLEPGESCEVDVAFAPTTPSEKQAHLWFPHSGPFQVGTFLKGEGEAAPPPPAPTCTITRIRLTLLGSPITVCL